MYKYLKCCPKFNKNIKQFSNKEYVMIVTVEKIEI